jgi:hypothetical protein
MKKECCRKNLCDLWCWWCCHPFDTPPLSMPVSYNQATDVFDVYGNFCSFACMKAYNHNEHDANKMSQYSLISLLISKTCKDNVNVNVNVDKFVCAPPRQMLNVFGGSMTISEFRSCSISDGYTLHPPNTISVNHTIEKQKKSNFKWIKSHDDSSERSYSMKDFEAKSTGERVNNNAIKIKPIDKTKQPSINTLEMVLGLF